MSIEDQMDKLDTWISRSWLLIDIDFIQNSLYHPSDNRINLDIMQQGSPSVSNFQRSSSSSNSNKRRVNLNTKSEIGPYLLEDKLNELLRLQITNKDYTQSARLAFKYPFIRSKLIDRLDSVYEIMPNLYLEYLKRFLLIKNLKYADISMVKYLETLYFSFEYYPNIIAENFQQIMDNFYWYKEQTIMQHSREDILLLDFVFIDILLSNISWNKSDSNMVWTPIFLAMDCVFEQKIVDKISFLADKYNLSTCMNVKKKLLPRNIWDHLLKILANSMKQYYHIGSETLNSSNLSDTNYLADSMLNTIIKNDDLKNFFGFMCLFIIFIFKLISSLFDKFNNKPTGENKNLLLCDMGYFFDKVSNERDKLIQKENSLLYTFLIDACECLNLLKLSHNFIGELSQLCNKYSLFNVAIFNAFVVSNFDQTLKSVISQLPDNIIRNLGISHQFMQFNLSHLNKLQIFDSLVDISKKFNKQVLDMDNYRKECLTSKIDMEEVLTHFTQIVSIQIDFLTISKLMMTYLANIFLTKKVSYDQNNNHDFHYSIHGIILSQYFTNIPNEYSNVIASLPLDYSESINGYLSHIFELEILELILNKYEDDKKAVDCIMNNINNINGSDLSSNFLRYLDNNIVEIRKMIQTIYHI